MLRSYRVSLRKFLLLMYTWGVRGLVNLVSFGDFLKPLSCLLPEITSFSL